MTDIAFLVSPEGIEQRELTEPWEAVRDAGFQPRLVATDGSTVQAFHHLDPADKFHVDLSADETSAGDFAGLVLPGGVANGDLLRSQPDAVRLAAEFARSGKPIAAICHGGWVLIEADAVRGRRLTSWPSMRTDFTNAGADWVDDEVVVDTNGPGPLISSRKPDDIPAFNDALLGQLAH